MGAYDYTNVLRAKSGKLFFDKRPENYSKINIKPMLKLLLILQDSGHALPTQGDFLGARKQLPPLFCPLSAPKGSQSSSARSSHR